MLSSEELDAMDVFLLHPICFICAWARLTSLEHNQYTVMPFIVQSILTITGTEIRSLSMPAKDQEGSAEAQGHDHPLDHPYLLRQHPEV